jgi:multidrug efflux system membrane fusion protein
LLNGEFKAEIRQVKTGPSRNDLTIIDDGLKAGETVVVDGQIRLAPGVKAEVRKQITVGEPTS